MSRKPRNPGSGKPPHNGPAAGPGWGGAAKGEGRKSAGKLIPGAGPKAGCAVPGVQGFVPLYRTLEKRERIEAAMQYKWEVMNDPNEFTQHRLKASDDILDREIGKPTAAPEEGAGGMTIRIIGGLPDDARDDDHAADAAS
jgi:hypothetical protein